MPDEVHAADTYVCLEREMPDYRSTWVGSIEDDERDFLARYVSLGAGIIPAKPAKTLIVCLVGAKRAGKDTAANALIEKQGFERLGFADALKSIALAADPYVSRFRPGDTIAEQMSRTPYERLSFVVALLGWEKAKELPDVRRFLERLGTEGLRDHLGRSVLIDAAFANVKPGGRYVFADGRFENEAEAVRARGGRVWKIERPGFEPDESHSSQAVRVPAHLIDRVIVNDGTRADLRRAVLAEWTPA